MEYILRVNKINPYCGCGDKAFYVLYKVKDGVEDVMGRDEFPYKNEHEFNTKLEELKVRFKATVEIEP